MLVVLPALFINFHLLIVLTSPSTGIFHRDWVHGGVKNFIQSEHLGRLKEFCALWKEGISRECGLEKVHNSVDFKVFFS